MSKQRYLIPMLKTILYLSFLVIFTTACQSEQINNFTDGNDLEDPISYASQIQPIFNSSCSGSGCHINNTRSGVNLTNFSNTTNSSGSSYGRLIVVSGNADNSPLVDVLEPDPSSSRRMPLNGSPLTSNEITLIRTWINQGAQNN